jgi:PPOX class probable F420-dependent enzyme
MNGTDPAGTTAPDWKTFWTERRLCMLATRRKDGTTHLVPVVATYDETTGTAYVITVDGSMKVRNIESAPGGTAWVTVSQADRGRWTTLEGEAVVRREPEIIDEAVRRYSERYPDPGPNPKRVAIEIAVRRVMGTVKVPLPAAAAEAEQA